MRNRFPNCALLVARSVLVAVMIMIAGVQTTLADISTLFTTQQERQIIDRNRYKNQPLRQTQSQSEKPKVEAINQLVREEVKKSYSISGISISNDGAHSVWINGQIYEDGELIDGKSRLKVISGSDIKVRITAPDGKSFFGTSGETVEVSYLEAVDSWVMKTRQYRVQSGFALLIFVAVAWTKLSSQFST